VHVTALTGKARQAADLTTARLNIYEGAVRSGKTVGSLLTWLRFVRQGPAGPLLMVGKTERTLRRNVLDPLVEMLGEKRCRIVAGSGEVFLLGRKVYMVGANDERARDKIKGLTLAGTYVDEATTLPESFWTMLLTRLSIPGARLIATTNPEGPRHWLKRRYLDRARLHLTRDGQLVRSRSDDTLDLHRFSFQLRDNPTLPAAYIADIEREFTGLWRRRLILGDWCVAEGVVYDGWDERRHIVDALPPIARWISLGVDYGTVNPFAALVLAVGADNLLYLTSEWRYDSRAAHRQLTDHEYSVRLRGWLAELVVPGMSGKGVHPEWTCVDPSAASFVTQLHRDGLTPTLANNDVLDGIRQIASLLATDRLRVHRGCSGWISEIPNYAWDDKASEQGNDKPVKVDDHSLDAGRYALHTTEAVWLSVLRAEVSLVA
jgi:PBSX family phage terminase large subunit